jgi:hypothetical protein
MDASFCSTVGEASATVLDVIGADVTGVEVVISGPGTRGSTASDDDDDVVVIFDCSGINVIGASVTGAGAMKFEGDDVDADDVVVSRFAGGILVDTGAEFVSSAGSCSNGVEDPNKLSLSPESIFILLHEGWFAIIDRG